MTPLRRAATAALLATSLLSLAACGDDTDGAGAAPAPSGAGSSTAASSASSVSPATASDDATAGSAGDPAAELKRILQAYTDGDADFACSRQTAAYTAYSIDVVVSSDALPAGATCADTVRFSGDMARKFKQDNVSGAYDVRSDDGTKATVVHVQGGTPVTYRLVVEDGVWKIDADR